MALKTRKPTGRAGWPKILVEGTDKSGKSWSLAQLSASPKVGRTVVLALGEDETRWDEYGLIPGTRFEIALHDGTWPSIMGAVEEAKEEAATARDAGEPPFVFGFDTMTAEWDGLKDWATFRARNSKKNKLLLAQDPDADVEVTINYWNDARRRHRALMRHLLTFPGIVVLIARGSEVAQVQNGQPVAGRKTWSVEGEKNLPFDVSAHVRLSRESRPLLVSASGVHCQVRPGIEPPRRLPDDWSLESVIFETLKLDAASAHVGEFTEMKPDGITPEQIRDEAVNPRTSPARVRELYREAKRLAYDGITVTSETGAEELLLTLLGRIGAERTQGGAAPPAAPPGRPASPPQAAPATASEDWVGDAKGNAAKAPTVKACRALWAETVQKARAGEISRPDAGRVQEILKGRIEDLNREAAREAIGDPADPWAVKVDDLASEQEATAALAELAVSGTGADRAGRVRAAILIRFPQAAREAQAAA